MAIRQEEQLCADALQAHLRDKFGLQSEWRGVDRDPPDLHFDVTRKPGTVEPWAVEVTGLVQYIDWNGTEQNRRIFEPAIFKMVKRLNEDMREKMNRGYILSVTGPLEPAIFRDLERRVTEYVTSGRSEEEALDYADALESVLSQMTGDRANPGIRWAAELVAKDRTTVTMKGVAGSNSIVVVSGISGTAKVPKSEDYAADLDASLEYSTARILKAKLPRLAPLTGYARKVLLIWNGIPFAEPDDMRRHFSALHPDGIDGIFFFQSGKGQVSLVLDNGLGIDTPS